MHKRKMKSKMNKKGDVAYMGKKVVNIIMAILCILVLLLVGVYLWNLFISKPSDVRKAENNLDLLIDKIQSLSNSQDKEDSVIIFPPKKEAGWILKSYGPDYGSGQPAGICVGDRSCLCFYEGSKECIDFGPYVDPPGTDSYWECYEIKAVGELVCKGTDLKLIIKEDSRVSGPDFFGTTDPDKYKLFNAIKTDSTEVKLNLKKNDEGVIEITKAG